MERVWRLFAVWMVCCGACLGQVVARGRDRASEARRVVTLTGGIPAGTAAVLQSMASRATVIFTGHVVEVDRRDSAGYVDVTFLIDRAVKGCSVAEKYVLREWAGRWSGEPNRYRVGERLLMLLPARGSSGLSEPVDGMAGAIPLVATRTPPIVHGAGNAPPETAVEDGQEPAADLRWVQALAVRSVVTTVASGQPRPEAMRVGSGDWAGPVSAMGTIASGSAGPGLSAVLGLLGGTNVP